jgi:hypothetical protein
MMNMRKLLVITALAASLATLGADRAAAAAGTDECVSVIDHAAWESDPWEPDKDVTSAVQVIKESAGGGQFVCFADPIDAPLPQPLGTSNLVIQLNSLSVTADRRGVAFSYGNGVTGFLIDGSPSPSGTKLPASTAEPFSHQVQFDYGGSTFHFTVGKDASSDRLKAFTIQGGAAPPTITSLSAKTGTITGGEIVRIRGTNFIEGATSVTFGGVQVADEDFIFDNVTQIRVRAPKHDAGEVNVVVETSAGKSTGTWKFTYEAVPQFVSIDPTSGPTNGGITVTIKGSSFSAKTRVWFGNTSILRRYATDVEFIDDKTIKVTLPAAAELATGKVQVGVEEGGVSHFSVSAFEYLDTVAAPKLSQVTPVDPLTNDSTPSYTFESNVAAAIRYIGDCGNGDLISAVVGRNNTVTFNTLDDGTYENCTVELVQDDPSDPDDPDLISNVLKIPNFEINTTAPRVDFVNVPTQVSDNTTFTFGTVFSETVTGFNAEAFDITNASVTRVFEAGVGDDRTNVYAVDIRPDGGGNIIFSIKPDVVKDRFGNSLAIPSTPVTVEYDKDVAAPVLTLVDGIPHTQDNSHPNTSSTRRGLGR